MEMPDELPDQIFPSTIVLTNNPKRFRTWFFAKANNSEHEQVVYTRAPQWLPINSAPRDGTWILIFQKRENGNHARYVREARWSESKNSWGSATALNSVTHWMPLPPTIPAPPEVG